MTKEEIILRVDSIMAVHTGVGIEDIKPEDFPDELGADSLKCLEASLEIEEDFDINITAADIISITTMQDVYDMVERKINEQ